MTSDPDGIPPVLLHHLKHNKVLHQRVLLMSVITAGVPRVEESERETLRDLGEGFHHVVARYGFMETPDVPALLRGLADHGLVVKLAETSFYLGRETLILTDRTYIIFDGLVLVSGDVQTVLHSEEARRQYFGDRFDAASIIAGKEEFNRRRVTRLVPPAEDQAAA